MEKLLPQSAFLHHPLCLVLYLELLIHHGRDQPVCIYFHVVSVCIAWVCWAPSPAWRLLAGACPTTECVRQPVGTAEMRGGTLASFLLANENITILKWCGNSREEGSSGGRGFVTHNTGVHVWQHSQRVVWVGTARRQWELEDVVPPGAPRLWHYNHRPVFFFHLLDSIFQRDGERVEEGGGRIK